MTLEEALKWYRLLDKQVLSEGTFRRTRYWFFGWHPPLIELGEVKFIHGTQGRETQLTITGIVPVVKFEVKK